MDSSESDARHHLRLTFGLVVAQVGQDYELRNDLLSSVLDELGPRITALSLLTWAGKFVEETAGERGVPPARYLEVLGLGAAMAGEGFDTGGPEPVRSDVDAGSEALHDLLECWREQRDEAFDGLMRAILAKYDHRLVVEQLVSMLNAVLDGAEDARLNGEAPISSAAMVDVLRECFSLPDTD